MRYVKSKLFITALLFVVAVGCSKQAADSSPATDASVTLVNSVCPIEGGEANSEVTADWDGKTVGFCCAECLPAWNKLSDEDKAAKLASAGSDSSSGHGQEAASNDAS